jgi:hypothetical protein
LENIPDETTKTSAYNDGLGLELEKIDIEERSIPSAKRAHQGFPRSSKLEIFD